MPADRRPSRFRADVFALVAYSALALALTFPLVLHFTTHVPGDGGDDPALAWNLWWVPYAIINLGQSPIYTQHMFYPIGINLAFYTLTYLNAFLSIPLQYATNLVIATNANVWFSFVVGGFGAYLLVKYVFQVSGFTFQVIQPDTANLKPETLAAFIAGALYAFSANKLLYVSLGQFNIASSHWIPYYVLFLLKVAPLGNRSQQSVVSSQKKSELRITNYELRTALRYGFLLGLFLLFQALSEFIYASFLIIFTAIYFVYWLVANRFRPPSFVPRLWSFVVAVITFTIPMSPILAAMIQDMLTEGDFIQQGLGFADVFSSDVLGFFVPSKLHPILGALESQFHFAYANFAYLGFVALALAILALWKIPRARSWGVFGAIFILISLGPALVVNGKPFDLPMAFDILLEIPFVKGNRYPSRWSVMVTLALAVLVGYGIVWASQKLKVKGKKWNGLFAFAFLLLTLFEHFAVLPLSDFRIPDVYKTIAQDEGDFTVLAVPLAWRNGFRMTGTLDQAMMFAQWYQTAHRRPMLSGNTSRNPELKFQYFTEAPVINELIWTETGHPSDEGLWYNARKIAPAVLRFFNVRYIVWHSPRQEQNRAALDAAREYIEYVFPVTKFYDATDETGHTIAYRVRATADSNVITIQADELKRLHFAEGWGALITNAPIWATRRQAKVFVRVDAAHNHILSFSAFSPVFSQRVRVEVNGNLLCALSLAQGEGVYTCRAVGAQNGWRTGLNEIVFRFEQIESVASLVVGEYTVGTTGFVSPVSLVATSAASEVGDFAHIYVDGVETSLNQRGYNIVVINRNTGSVEARAAFDTFKSADESARLAQFINAIPPERVVIVAVRDEAARNLTEEAVNALRSLGATQDLRGKFRWSHAIIGIKGARPGTALESASEILPAQLVIGIGATEPNVAAAIEWIKIEEAK